MLIIIVIISITVRKVLIASAVNDQRGSIIKPLDKVGYSEYEEVEIMTIAQSVVELYLSE